MRKIRPLGPGDAYRIGPGPGAHKQLWGITNTNPAPPTFRLSGELQYEHYQKNYY